MLRTADPSLDVDPDKDSRPYLVISDSGYTTATSNCTCLPVSSFSFISQYEVLIHRDGQNNLANDSYVHCHGIQTLEKSFLSSRRGLLVDAKKRKDILVTTKLFIGQP